jgi:hypothetical protein
VPEAELVPELESESDGQVNCGARELVSAFTVSRIFKSPFPEVETVTPVL